MKWSAAEGGFFVGGERRPCSVDRKVTKSGNYKLNESPKSLIIKTVKILLYEQFKRER